MYVRVYEVEERERAAQPILSMLRLLHPQFSYQRKRAESSRERRPSSLYSYVLEIWVRLIYPVMRRLRNPQIALWGPQD